MPNGKTSPAVSPRTSPSSSPTLRQRIANSSPILAQFLGICVAPAAAPAPKYPSFPKFWKPTAEATREGQRDVLLQRNAAVVAEASKWMRPGDFEIFQSACDRDVKRINKNYASGAIQYESPNLNGRANWIRKNQSKFPDGWTCVRFMDYPEGIREHIEG